MSDILFHYEKVNPTSWAYLSSLLMLALFFKFNRVFSVRNLDLFLLLLISPGLLLVKYSIENEGHQTNALLMQRLGYLWLFGVGVLLLTRLLLDSAMTRRPLLEPNLNAAGLAFLGSSLLFFMTANVVTGKPLPSDWLPARSVADIKADQESDQATDTFESQGPGYWALYLLPRITTQKAIAGAKEAAPVSVAAEAAERQSVRETTARVMAIMSNVLIIVGLVIVGARHFGNATAGLATATMYLLLPYTAMWSGSVAHALPASLLVWAIVCYRRPLLAGMLIGLAAGTIYYPAFLLPLWCSFYWERGLKRFLTGVILTLAALVLTIALTSGDLEHFFALLVQMFGVRKPMFDHLQGIWRKELGWSPWYRLPILAAFVALAISFVFWPVKKHLGTLISCTAAIMVGAQFWHAHNEGGVYVAWYLPLLLLTIYRPNLEDRIALATVSEGWWQRRKARAAPAAQGSMGPH